MPFEYGRFVGNLSRRMKIHCEPCVRTSAATPFFETQRQYTAVFAGTEQVAAAQVAPAAGVADSVPLLHA